MKNIEMVKGADGTWEIKMPEAESSQDKANLQRDTWMDKEILGIPVVPGLVGGGVAELASSLIAKIPQLSTIFGGNVMITDLVAAAALGYFGNKKHWDWAKYGSMFLVFAAFQAQIQQLIGGIVGGINIGTSQWANDSASMSGVGGTLPDELESWLHTGR